ncbi:NUDIX hydrolase [Agilicoccus flavus]|uniref:NUDIX hydrolase n=1 Tax=Agilicoccus flavus TaxID=2775968 RepID=UPI001CF6DB04|nr:NUDIX domain-containing protein [Agilicoccus flavus]
MTSRDAASGGSDPRSERAVADLLAHAPAGPDQAALRDAFVAHLRAHPDALSRSGPPAHLTAGCVVLDARSERVCLVLHRKARAWFQPGGHLEAADAGLAAAAARESREETGLPGLVVDPHPVDLDRHALSGAFGRCTEHLDVRFLAVAPEGAEPVCSPESLDVRWWPVDDLPTAEPALARLVAAGLERATRPTEPASDGVRAGACGVDVP